MSAPKISKDAIRQTIDLDDFLNVDLSDQEGLKQAIAQAVIDQMLERTSKGMGMRFSSNGSGTEVDLQSPYSDAYAKSLPFKAAGKKKGKVNMELTGDMLASVDVESVSGNKIVIAIDEEQVLKAFNHLTGDTVPQRPWFGVSKSEIRDILKDFSSEIKAVAENSPDAIDNRPETEGKLSLLELFKDEGASFNFSFDAEGE